MSVRKFLNMLVPAFLALCGVCGADLPADIPSSAQWELGALGIANALQLSQIRALAGRRPVRLAIVGTGGVSGKLLANLLTDGASLDYAMAPDMNRPDPETSTHDTGQATVILDLTRALGVGVRVRVYQEADEPGAWAEALRSAGSQADIVVFFQSYWGEIDGAVEAIRKSPALFVCPYAEVGENPTKTCIQGYSAKPWGQGISNLVTVAPLPRKGGQILALLDRPELDTEVINFVAPSFHASGPGGTCPAAAVAAAVACYAFAASAESPGAVELADLLRASSVLDAGMLASVPELDAEKVAVLASTIESYRQPAAGKRRLLDAPGVLNLRELYRRIGRR